MLAAFTHDKVKMKTAKRPKEDEEENFFLLVPFSLCYALYSLPLPFPLLDSFFSLLLILPLSSSSSFFTHSHSLSLLSTSDPFPLVHTLLTCTLKSPDTFSLSLVAPLLHASTTRSLLAATYTAMATNHHTATQLAVSIPIPPGSSSSMVAARYQVPEPQEAPIPVPPIHVAGSTPVSTPTSGMHSPPLSSTLEEEANEKRAAHVAATINRGQLSDLGNTPTSSTTATGRSSGNSSNLALQATRAAGPALFTGSRRPGGDGRGFPSLTAPTTQKLTKAKPGVRTTQFKSQADAQMHSSGGKDRARDSNASAHSVGSRTAVDQVRRPDLHQVRQSLSKEKTIEHVLQQGKILKVRNFFLHDMHDTLFRDIYSRCCATAFFHFSARKTVSVVCLLPNLC